MAHDVNPEPRRPFGLLALLVAAAAVGLAGAVAALVTAFQGASTERQTAQYRTELLERIRDLEENNATETVEHRERNEAIHADLCRLIYEVVQQSPSLRDRGIRPCEPPLIPSSDANGDPRLVPQGHSSLVGGGN